MKNLIAALVVMFFFNGCAAIRTDKAQTDTVRHETTAIDFSIPFPAPQVDGTVRVVDYPIHLNMVRDSSEVAKTDATRTSTISAPEIGGIIRAALAQFAPGLSQLMTPIAAGGNYTRELVAGGAGLLATVLALMKAQAERRRGDEHKADSDEGWKRALAKEPNVQPS